MIELEKRILKISLMTRKNWYVQRIEHAKVIECTEDIALMSNCCAPFAGRFVIVVVVMVGVLWHLVFLRNYYWLTEYVGSCLTAIFPWVYSVNKQKWLSESP